MKKKQSFELFFITLEKVVSCAPSSAAQEQSSARLPAVAWLTVYRRIPVRSRRTCSRGLAKLPEQRAPRVQARLEASLSALRSAPGKLSSASTHGPS
eukprot:1885024-Pyramimonas_sp.AAC.1